MEGQHGVAKYTDAHDAEGGHLRTLSTLTIYIDLYSCILSEKLSPKHERACRPLVSTRLTAMGTGVDNVDDEEKVLVLLEIHVSDTFTSRQALANLSESWCLCYPRISPSQAVGT